MTVVEILDPAVTPIDAHRAPSILRSEVLIPETNSVNVFGVRQGEGQRTVAIKRSTMVHQAIERAFLQRKGAQVELGRVVNFPEDSKAVLFVLEQYRRQLLGA